MANARGLAIRPTSRAHTVSVVYETITAKAKWLFSISENPKIRAPAVLPTTGFAEAPRLSEYARTKWTAATVNPLSFIQEKTVWFFPNRYIINEFFFYEDSKLVFFYRKHVLFLYTCYCTNFRVLFLLPIEKLFQKVGFSNIL